MEAVIIVFYIAAVTAVSLLPTWLIGVWGKSRRKRLGRDARRLLLSHVPVSVQSTRDFPADIDTTAGMTLVEGSCVISPDAWQGFLAAFPSVLGGSIESYAEGWRVAREVAVGRMTAEASRLGYNHVVNVRIQQVNLNHHDTSKGKGAFAVLVYGTACRTRSS